jgi:hypothetical protein
LRLIPWLRATRILNGFAILSTGLVVFVTTLSGGFTVGGSGWDTPRGAARADAPDVYLIMLDGYPRADTLAADFDLDNEPFLSSMQSMGFEVATNSHSNYVSTVLTLASMFNGEQIRTLIPQPPSTESGQFRAVTRLINEGENLRRFRQAGYEIVSVPSEYSEGALVNADRVLDSGQITSFEMQLLRTGALPQALGGLEAGWFPEDHRQRIFSTFDRLGDLAAEREASPKLVFAHFLVPHMPLTFAADGSMPSMLSCFPQECSLFSYGDEFAKQRKAGMRDQVTWLNRSVEQLVRTIKSTSAEPPVIVIFSDHGTRFFADDHDEMFRSLFLASTPGRTALFPSDATPVNILTRLLNAYTDSTTAMSSEESYWLNTRLIDEKGLFALTSADQAAHP